MFTVKRPWTDKVFLEFCLTDDLEFTILWHPIKAARLTKRESEILDNIAEFGKFAKYIYFSIQIPKFGIEELVGETITWYMDGGSRDDWPIQFDDYFGSWKKKEEKGF